MCCNFVESYLPAFEFSSVWFHSHSCEECLNYVLHSFPTTDSFDKLKRKQKNCWNASLCFCSVMSFNISGIDRIPDAHCGYRPACSP